MEQLELLRKLFRNVYAPPAVWSEATGDATAPGADVLLGASWIRVRAPGVVPASRLGLGEREAMGLAAELSAVLVVDDGAARVEAVALGVRITGTLGILRRAKREGLLAAVAPTVSRMRAIGLRASDALVEALLRDVEE
ncbi:MAG: DUF3368 domain-containing protein [Deltaproteobacteria bacterium]|nr:DUF3368 domain-containing protein [Deltaproteobacteria bacterium]